ncbi:MAG: hypothetical protein HY303_04380 [Candidatus Wallbacteria bacterium]|nr:hypothetical protein [Candidatus Wallbacteria bacterium]
MAPTSVDSIATSPSTSRSGHAAAFEALLSRPAFWLAIQALLFVGCVYRDWGFGCRMVEDSPSYFDLVEQRLLSVSTLAGIWTVGFPFFLRVLSRLNLIPYFGLCQSLCYISAILVFHLGLRRVGFGGAVATAAASTLFYLNVLIDRAGEIHPTLGLSDCLAFSLAIVSLSAVLTLSSNRGSRGDWALLCLGLFACCQVRPAFQFMLVLVPLLGVSLLRLLRGTVEFQACWKRHAAALVAAAWIPFLLFCTMRWAAVGQFGLVSLTGTCLGSLTGQFLRPQLLEKIAPEQRPLAAEFLRELEKYPGYRCPVSGDHDVDVELVATNYCALLSFVVPPLMERLHYREADRDAKLFALSMAILRASPATYATWLRRAFAIAIATGARDSIQNPMIVLLCLLVLAQRALGKAGGWSLTAGRGGADPPLLLRVSVVLAAAFTLLDLILVLSLQAPWNRYVRPAFAFWPMAAVSGLLCLLPLDSVRSREESAP